MENKTKRYWRGIEELTNDAEFVKNSSKEFADFNLDPNSSDTLTDGAGTHRRDFLKMLGFSVAAVSLAACEAPVQKAIPYLNKPEEIEPSIANWYASTYTDGGDYASVLVKTREGRPIKLEGNRLSSVSMGGLSARAQASLLSLYDNEKLKGPQEGGKDTTWKNLDQKVAAQLSRSRNVRVVSSTILSPATKAVINDFKTKYPSVQHIQYDADSMSGLLAANGGIMPSYDFSKARVIVGLSCDFLGSWASSQIFQTQYAKTRKLNSAKGGKKEMSRHYQFETILSNTGANADYRTAIKPSQEGLVAAAFYNKLAAKLGGSPISTPAFSATHLDQAVNDLVAARGAALVVSGSNDTAVQTIVNGINGLLGSYGSTIDLGTPSNFRQGNDAAMNTFVEDLKAGRIDAVIFYGANPVYNHPRSKEIEGALARVPLTVSFAERADETASLCKFIAPDSHFLESWNDAEPKRGFYSIGQPTISTIFNTRQAQASMLTWAGLANDYLQYLKDYWEANLYPLSDRSTDFKAFWIQTLHDGVFEPTATASSSTATMNADVASAAGAIARTYKASSGNMELALYQEVGIGTGSQANNPWLQELPDPVTKACWDNYAMISQKTAAKLGLKQNDIVKVDVAGRGAVELPVLVQPGQADDTVAVAIGYGRTKAGKSANGVGVNMYPFVGLIAPNVTVAATGDTYAPGIAQTQTHHTVMGRRAVIQESVLGHYQKNIKAGRFEPRVQTSVGAVAPNSISLWNGHEKKNHSWGMVIDLNSCTGCGACVIGCQSENNIAVVGRREVIMRREMHWIRIDRYYSSDAELEDLKGLEIASDNPEVTYQPMLCQHCSNAPCETVCPVLATTHSSEGLNQMTYNRCIGTRYCANNCPYKVRRFNWFKYFNEDKFDFHFNNDLGKMVINPEVTVRSRGVMEKCSFCVQRIQETKLRSKKERRRPEPNEVETACSQSCPTGAIVFGDMNNTESEISKVLAVEREGRAFHVLEEINVLPQISYLVKIRNKEAPREEARQMTGETHKEGV
ncbi:MAG: TAT-variant-translocated molybdopterin oxidoreductase [Cytophagaceae bacterium]|nr:TAT-variant-translocated molybdopterin oxidoreductase [Cytophagaceae bacterium]